MWKITRVSSLKIVSLTVDISPLFRTKEMSKPLCKETTKNDQLSQTKNWISNSFLIIQNLIAHATISMEGQLKLRLQSI